MLPTEKKPNSKKQNLTLSNSLSKKERGTECEKENRGLREKCELGVECKNSDVDELISPLKEKANLKPFGFWSQKVKNLEPDCSFIKSKKHELYEFSGTESDESGSSYKRKKKVKGKPGPRKKKQRAVPKSVQKPAATPSLRKVKQIHSKTLLKEQIILNKERKKLDDIGKKFTFSTGLGSLGITSTPMVRKANLIGASNFLFLSPIQSEECVQENVQECTSPKKPKVPDTPVEFETPKLIKRRMGCKMVLRNGKIL